MSTNTQKMHLYITDEAFTYLIDSELPDVKCPRGSWYVDHLDVPISFEVNAGDDAYTLNAWERIDNGREVFEREAPIILKYGDRICIGGELDEYTLKLHVIYIVSCFDRWLALNHFWETHEKPGKQGGLLLDVANDELQVTVVNGMERPEMVCYSYASLFTDNVELVVARPYRRQW